MFIFNLHVHILSVYVIVVKFIHVVKFIGGGIMSTLQKFKGGLCPPIQKWEGGGGVVGVTFVLHSVE